MAARDPDGRIGTVLDGRYRILEPLSRGGMGVVYRAERVPVGRPVAVKFLHALFADDPDSRARFERETRALARLAHPHCVSIIDFGYDGAPYLVMELVAGATLRELLDEGPLPVTDALTIARQLLAALAHAHAEGIVHRDVKPANVMVTDEIGTGRHARILDFGLARLVERGATNITQASIAIGTPSYMAPEQTRGGDVDARTDLYAVGVLLFEMVTGQRPFVAEDTAALLELHRSAPPPHLAEADPTRAWPAGLDEVIQRALKKDPDDRWQSAGEFAAALETRREPSARTVRRTEDGGGGGRRGAALLGLLLVGAGAVAAFVIMRGGAASRPAATDGAGVIADAGPTPVAAAPAATTPRDAAAPAVDAAAVAPDAAAVAPDAPVALSPEDAAAAGGGDGGMLALPSEDDIELEPLPAADPEIEAVEPGPGAVVDDDGAADPAGATVVPPPPPTPAPRVAPPPPRTAREALALAKQGHRDEAIAGLRALWKKRPRDADLPYLLGNLYHDKRWWSVAMEHYQAAITRAPSYRRNATLIRNVIAELGSTRTRAKASWFLRKVVGAPAKAHLKTAAKRHKSAAVRRNAAAVLRRF